MTKTQLRNELNSRDYTRGLDYYRRGKIVNWVIINGGSASHTELSGEVEGSGPYSYLQDIKLNHTGSSLHISGHCSCPVHYNCKHVAAVCLEYVEHMKSSNTHDLDDTNAKQFSVELQQSLNAIVNAGSEGVFQSAAGFAPSDTPRYPAYILSTYMRMKDGIRLSGLQVQVRLTRPKKNNRGLIKGTELSLTTLCNPIYSPYDTAISAFDRDIGCLVSGINASQSSYYNYHQHNLSDRLGSVALNMMIESNRCFWLDLNKPPLSFGEPRKMDIEWEILPDGSKKLLCSNPDELTILPVEPPMYIDAKNGTVGLIQSEWTGAQLLMIEQLPSIPDDQIERFSDTLFDQFPDLALPHPEEIKIADIRSPATPWLTLTTIKKSGDIKHCVLLDFDYGGKRLLPIPIEDKSMIKQEQQRCRIHRDLEAEQHTVEYLIQLGFTEVNSHYRDRRSHCYMPFGNTSVLESVAIWADFIEQELEDLRDKGWKIDFDENFSLEFLDADWSATVEEDWDHESGYDWFELRFDLQTEGKKIPMAPLLVPILEMAESGQDLPEVLTLPFGNNRYLRLPSERITPFLQILSELFAVREPTKDGNFRLSSYEAILVERLGDRLEGAKKLKELARKLKNFSGIQKIPPPQGLLAELRPYQQEGLNWLQFLREYRFNGILADDMGLGKTVQTLAHLQVEKQQGRLTQPALIVAPTSLMGNWRQEAERFTPELTVLVLQGSDRQSHFKSILEYDLVLTTYPLIIRDIDSLSAHTYHSVILDEAQNIKNPRSKVALLIKTLKSEHRLCLSGTPLENHLGELWALFDFLMPGFLGGSKQFKRFYRTPIEKYGDGERGNHLSDRVQPFLLRRLKSEVAKELPAKSEIPQSIELDTQQAELYESIRLTMDKQVRDAIASRGLGRSHITILDALLKLRQVCCDPRLLKLKVAQKVTRSAKLERLMVLLPQLLEEGRRVLLFSQFTSMLALIETELNQSSIAYTKLTGQTRKRENAIQQFRSGEVDLFLISLKSGGTGLNLVEADTVIIYDPWWNPAVENQAIDRAHRIGQDKPVFVYKLIVKNSVEEKMLEMQKDKQSLADGLYSAQSGSQENALMDENRLKALFDPLIN